MWRTSKEHMQPQLGQTYVGICGVPCNPHHNPAVCLWSGLHAQGAFWHCNCGQHGSSGIPIPSESFFDRTLLKNHAKSLKRLKQGSFSFSPRKMLSRGGAFWHCKMQAGWMRASGKSIGSRAECVAPRIWLRSHRRIIAFYWFYKGKYSAKCRVFLFVLPTFLHVFADSCNQV